MLETLMLNYILEGNKVSSLHDRWRQPNSYSVVQLEKQHFEVIGIVQIYEDVSHTLYNGQANLFFNN